MAASIIGKWKFVQPGIGLSVVLVMSADLSLGTALFLRPDQTFAQEPLLRTKWEQINGFEKYTPGHQRTGCWSTALAQIACYHKLEPHGRMDYVCSDGQIINENLSSREFALADFQESITDQTLEDIGDQMAAYNYFAAAVVKKDFGTGGYVHKLAPANLIDRSLAGS